MGKDSQVGADALKDVDDLALVGSALALGLDVENDDGDQDEYRRMTHELCRRGTQLIFDEMARLTLGEDLQARILACNILGELGFKQGRPFGAETFPLLARLCTEEASPPVLGAAISAMGNLGRPEALPYVVAHATHSDPDVRFSVACALPSVAEGEWLDQAHPLVTTLMQLTSDEDSDVRDWANFGLGTQVKVDGAAVRQRLIARLDDPDEDTRAEAIAGLAKRHAPEAIRHVRDALWAQAVTWYAVESACALGEPSFAERLAQLEDWWVVNVNLLKDARRRCGPTRIDDEVTLIRALIDAPELDHLSISFSSELLTNRAGDPEMNLVGPGIDVWYDMMALMERADGSVDAAVQLIQRDLKEADPTSG
jgi:hypothetical protein